MANGIKKIGEMGFRLEVFSPFIITFHHKDLFPQGNEQMEPLHYLEHWHKGNDFAESSPFRMYHGSTIPGFPVHPHRGFETITVVTEGMVDHADGLGAGGRYGNGDVQWMTAGSGLQHSEMFPLLNQADSNPMELFQIWLNLPAKNKFVSPYYNMLWNEEIPLICETNEQEKKACLRIINGQYKETSFYHANPDSWAFDPNNQVNIWLLKMEEGSTFTLPALKKGANRTLYFYEGTYLKVEEEIVSDGTFIVLDETKDITLRCVKNDAFLLLLDGRPINEPIAAYGPFVMNTFAEIEQAYSDYQSTQFGGWPWEKEDPVFPLTSQRFAKYPDKTILYPPVSSKKV